MSPTPEREASRHGPRKAQPRQVHDRREQQQRVLTMPRGQRPQWPRTMSFTASTAPASSHPPPKHQKASCMRRTQVHPARDTRDDPRIRHGGEPQARASWPNCPLGRKMTTAAALSWPSRRKYLRQSKLHLAAILSWAPWPDFLSRCGPQTPSAPSPNAPQARVGPMASRVELFEGTNGYRLPVDSCTYWTGRLVQGTGGLAVYKDMSCSPSSGLQNVPNSNTRHDSTLRCLRPFR